MGTDIHAAIEYKVDGKWHAYEMANKYYGQYENEPLLSAKVSIDRDYDLFAILAGVRNGFGFAGCKLGDGFEPISKPRGIPEDITEEGRRILSDEHSPTWVTLRELLEYDWTRNTNKYGVVSAQEFEEWDRLKQWHPAPRRYSGGISGPRIKMVDERRMREYVKSVMGKGKEHGVAVAELDENLYTQITWNETYAKAAEQIWTSVLPVMLKLATTYGINNIRMVMDFDS